MSRCPGLGSTGLLVSDGEYVAAAGTTTGTVQFTKTGIADSNEQMTNFWDATGPKGTSVLAKPISPAPLQARESHLAAAQLHDTVSPAMQCMHANNCLHLCVHKCCQHCTGCYVRHHGGILNCSHADVDGNGPLIKGAWPLLRMAFVISYSNRQLSSNRAKDSRVATCSPAQVKTALQAIPVSAHALSCQTLKHLAAKFLLW